jgi:nitrogen-specific signal transduction histidine kinase
MSEFVSGFEWLAVGSAAAGVGTLALVAYLWRHRGKPGANWFMAGLTAQAVFCLAAATDPFVGGVVGTALSTLTWTGFVATGPLFFAFTMDYTGRPLAFDNRATTAVLTLAAANTLAVATSPLHGRVWRPGPDGALAATAVVDPWGYVTVAFGTVLAGVGVLLLVETVIDYGPLYRREAAAVSLSSVVPTVVVVAWLLGLDAVPGLVAVGASFVPHVCLDAYAFVESDMFETNPATRRAAEQNAVDDIATPVFVLDEDDRVVEYNSAAGALVESSSTVSDPLGTPVSSVLDAWDEPATDGGRPATEERVVTSSVGGDHRQFRVSRSALTDPGDDRVGSTLVFEDVTRERRREQRLDVLNRVLRHNLRNRMTTVAGHAEVLGREADDERTERLAEMIDAAATDMLDAGEKAREFERLRESGPRYREVDVSACLADAVDDYRDHEGRIEVSADDATVRTDPRWVRLVVGNLVENALEHVEDPVLSVTATVGERDGELLITVCDDGDGIPASELEPMQSGTETALAHGTGIGLWVVEWSVTALGGSWAVDTDDGTTVTVRLPDGEDGRIESEAAGEAADALDESRDTVASA